MRLVRILLVAGVVASIATQQQSGWSIPNHYDVAAFTLSDQATEIHYLIHAELHGAGPFDGLLGSVQATIFMTPPAQVNGVTLELHGITHPDLQNDTGVAILKGSTNGSNLYVDAWLDCTTDPCVEDFELVIRRATVDPVEISGTIWLLTEGDADAPPEGTDVTMTVTGPT